MKKKSAGKFISVILAAAAFVFVLYGMNGTVLAPLPGLTLDDPTCVAVSDGRLVISDSNNPRLIFTDSELRVV